VVARRRFGDDTPSFLLLVAVALAWRWPWVGGVVFIALAVLYAVQAHEHVSWIVFIGGPLLSWWVGCSWRAGG
jgi:hypothetical protein